MGSKNSGNLATMIAIPVFLLLATLGAVSTITNEFVIRGGWLSVAYAAVASIFVVISINIFLLFISATETSKE